MKWDLMDVGVCEVVGAGGSSRLLRESELAELLVCGGGEWGARLLGWPAFTGVESLRLGSCGGSGAPEVPR